MLRFILASIILLAVVFGILSGVVLDAVLSFG